MTIDIAIALYVGGSLGALSVAAVDVADGTMTVRWWHVLLLLGGWPLLLPALAVDYASMRWRNRRRGGKRG